MYSDLKISILSSQNGGGHLDVRFHQKWIFFFILMKLKIIAHKITKKNFFKPSHFDTHVL